MPQPPTPVRRYHQSLLQTMQDIGHHQKWFTSPLNLGGVPGPGGGSGYPIGGLIGQLIQSKVAYDTTEAEVLSPPPSGRSLVGNLDTIRYRIGWLETHFGSPLIIQEESVQKASGVVIMNFQGGVNVTSPQPNTVNVIVTATGGGSVLGGVTVVFEDLTSQIPAADDFYVVSQPIMSGTSQLYMNGLHQVPSYYTETSSGVGLTETLVGTDELLIEYLTSGGTTIGLRVFDTGVFQASGVTALNFIGAESITVSGTRVNISFSGGAGGGGPHTLGSSTHSDVTITSVGDDDILAYDSGGDWINQTAAEAGLATDSHTHSDVVDVSADDTTAGYLEDKIVQGSNIAITVLNPAGDEDLEIAATGLSISGHAHSEYAPSGHLHDDRYYTETEVDGLLHDPVTVLDTPSLNLELAGQAISGYVISSGVNHGQLIGLEDNDHPQYAPSGHGHADTDTKQVLVSSDDTTEGYLEDKVVQGNNVTITVLNDGGNEQLQITASGVGGGSGVSDHGFLTGLDDNDHPQYALSGHGHADTDTKRVLVSSNDTTEGYLEDKIVAGTNITITTLDEGANETVEITSTASGGGGSAIEVRDEGVPLTSGVTSLDFVGGGVTATTIGDAVTVTIPSGLGGGGGGEIDFGDWQDGDLEWWADSSQATLDTNSYTKYYHVGRTVHVIAYLLSDSGSLAGTFTLRNLPVPVDSSLQVGVSPLGLVRHRDEGSAFRDMIPLADGTTATTINLKQIDSFSAYSDTIDIDDSMTAHLTYYAASGVSLSGGGGSGSPIDVDDEGINVASGVTNLNFVGGGVTATASGTSVTVTVPSGVGGGTSNLVYEYVGDGTDTFIDFTVTQAIRDSYDTLVFHIEGDTDRAGNTLEGLRLQFAPSGGAIDTGNNYWRQVREIGDSDVNEENTSGGAIWIGRYSMTGATADSPAGYLYFSMAGWDNNNSYVNVTGQAVGFGSTSSYRVSDFWGTWRNTTTPGTIRLYTHSTSNFTSDNRIRVYGLPNAGGGGGGGSDITVKDEGVDLTTGVTSLDFVGGGVTATASGTLATITIPSGVGGGGGEGTAADGSFWESLVKPVTSSALDDEFDDESFDTSLWTEFDPATRITISETEQGAKIAHSSAGSGLGGFYQDIPAGDFTIVARVSLSHVRETEAAVAIGLWEDAAGNPTTSDVYLLQMRWTATVRGVLITHMNDYTSWNSNDVVIDDTVATETFIYLRVRRTGTTYKFDRSLDGVGWEQLRSGTIPFTASEFGIVSANSGANDSYAAVSLFRYKDSDVGVDGILEGRSVAFWDRDSTAASIAGSTYSFFDINKPKAITDTPDDEFNSSTLNAKWTAVAGSSGTVDLFESSNVSEYDLTTRPGNLLMQVGQTGAQEVMLRQDYTLADGESIIVAVTPTLMSDDTGGTSSGITNNELQIGLSVNDDNTDHDAGNSHEVFFDANDNGWRIIQQAHNGASVVGGVTPGNAMPDMQKMYFRISRVSSVYYGFFSADGTNWFPLAGDTPAGTYDNVWIWVRSVATFGDPIPIQAFDWVRLGTNDLDPWDTEVTVGGADKKVTVFTVDDEVATASGTLRMYNKWGRSISISNVFTAVSTAPSGSALIVDINKDGTSIFTDQSKRPLIVSGAYTDTSDTPDIQAWANDSYLTMDVDQVGSTVAGSNLVVHVIGD